MMKKIGVGNDDFRRTIEEGYHYVDKTLMIKDFLDFGNVAFKFRRNEKKRNIAC